MSAENSCGRSVHDSDFAGDERGNLVYWDVLNQGYRLLEAGSSITDPDICIGKVGQQNLLPGHFSLKPKDREITFVTDEAGDVVTGVIQPGISTFLFWGSNATSQQDIASVAQSHLGREVTRKNRLYVTQVGSILRAGWLPYFAPLINRNYPVYNPLHVILCPRSMLLDGTRTDASEEEKAQLSRIFIRWP